MSLPSSSELSYISARSASGTYRSCALRRPAWYRRLTTSSGMRCPPRLTRRATRESATSADGSHKNIKVIRYPAERHRSNSRACPRPAQVVSKAKLLPVSTSSLRRSSISRPASIALASGSRGDIPRAISSAFTNSRISSVAFRRRYAQVVLPAPLGPPIITTSLLPRTAISAHAARSATTASSTGKPASVTRRRPLGVVSTTPSSCRMAMRLGSSGRPASRA